MYAYFINPVFYTHLDVYKRQAFCNQDLCLYDIDVRDHFSDGMFYPVSYTHLLSWACHMLGEEIHEALKDPAQYKIMEQRLRNCGYDFDQYGMPEPVSYTHLGH